MYCDADSNNNEEEESTTQKATNKKKSPKNKPFDGHGIGYHQGKTVVIKLVPAPETFNIINKPAFPMFDYFSKTPQVLPPKEIEGFGSGKQLKDLYKPYKEEEVQNLNSFNTADGKHEDNPNEIVNNSEPSSEVSKDSNSETQQSETSQSQNGKAATSSEIEDEELNEAFKRLQKILKTPYVYPSPVSDLEAYKVNTDYSEFEDPTREPKIAYDFMDHLPLNENENSKESSEEMKKHTDDSPVSSTQENEKKKLERLQNPKEMYETFIPVNEYDIPKEAEALYRTSYPFKIHQYLSNGTLVIQTPEYARYDNIKDKHNYSGLYDPSSQENKNEMIKKYELFGIPVPTYDKWYQKDYLKRNPVDYSKQSYSYVSPPNSSNEKIDDDASQSSEHEPVKVYEYTGSFSPRLKQAYTLFGAPVPLTNNWYKVDNEKLIEYDPYKQLHSTENSESNESYEGVKHR